MISNINGSGHVIVNNSYVSTYVGPNSSNPMQGFIRLNGNNLEVFDNSMWKSLSGGMPMIQLDSMAMTAIAWATQKQEEERKLKELAKDSQAVKIALDNLEKAKEQLMITAHLAKEQYETTS